MIRVNADRCPQNHKCPLIRLCPNEAIEQRNFAAPTISHDKCTGCRLCVNKCPYKALSDN